MNNLKIQVLSDDEMNQIIDQTFHLMETTGVSVRSKEVLDMLVNAGCTNDGETVFIPRAVVEKALETLPSEIDMYDRNGKFAFKVGGYNTNFGPGPTCPNYFDPETGAWRHAVKQDAADTAKVADSLPNIDFVMSLCYIGDVPASLADVHEIDAMVRNTTKPVISWTLSKESLQDMIDIVATVAGGLEKFQEKPFMAIYIEPITPFIHPEDVLDELRILINNKVPVIYSPGMIHGATCPITIAGALTVGLVDALTGVLISQLMCPGAKVISASPAGPMDMKTMVHSYGAPEAALMNMASCELLHKLGVPTFAVAGATDSKVPCDGQSAAESMIQMLGAISSGGNITHDAGFMDSGLTGSLDNLVMCNELIAMSKRFMHGIDVDEDHLALETIEEVGIGGNFIAEEHTAEFYRDETWMPKLLDRTGYSTWESNGAKTLKDVCHAKVTEILAAPSKSPLDACVISQLDAIIEKAEARANK